MSTDLKDQLKEHMVPCSRQKPAYVKVPGSLIVFNDNSSMQEQRSSAAIVCPGLARVIKEGIGKKMTDFLKENSLGDVMEFLIDLGFDLVSVTVTSSKAIGTFRTYYFRATRSFFEEDAEC